MGRSPLRDVLERKQFVAEHAVQARANRIRLVAIAAVIIVVAVILVRVLSAA